MKAAKATKLWRVGIYARVSTPEQKDNTSFDSQVKACREWAAQQDWTVVEEAVIEEDISGSRLRRPEFDKLIGMAAAGVINGVLVAKVDRFARDRYVDVKLEEKLAQHGASVLYVGRDTTTTDGRLFVNFEKTFAEWEKERIIGRLSGGKLEMLEGARTSPKGRVAGSRLVPFGYTYIKVIKQGNTVLSGGYYEIVPEEAEWVSKIFHWIAFDHLSLHAVARKLNSLGVPTRNGGHWTPPTVRYMIYNATYAGTYTHNRTESVLPDPLKHPHHRKTETPLREKSSQRPRDTAEWVEVPCPEIVTPAVQEAARRQLQLNRERSPRNCGTFYMLRGMLRCAECGERLTGHKIASGKYCNLYYDCTGRTKNAHINPADKCLTPHHNARRIEREVWEGVVRRFSDDAFVEGLLSERGSEWQAEVERLNNELAITQVAISKIDVEDARMVDAYKVGVISLDELKRHRANAQKDREKWQADATKLRERMAAGTMSEASQVGIRQYIARLRRGLPHFEDEGKRALLLALDFQAQVDAAGKLHNAQGWLSDDILPVLDSVEDGQEEAESLQLSIKPKAASNI